MTRSDHCRDYLGGKFPSPTWRIGREMMASLKIPSGEQRRKYGHRETLGHD
jgi:hypothetical protein